jgi:hypothetical protein
LTRLLALLGVLALQAGALPAAAHAQQQAQEHEVKAAFLYRFLSFIEWPAGAFPGPQAPYVIGVAGADDVAAALEEAMPGRPVQGRPVVVRRMRAGESLAGVHLLMVGRAEQAHIAQWAKSAPAHQTLIVGEAEDALDRGAGLGFLIDEGRVRFNVSMPNVEASGVRISSRMLAVAHDVRGARP